MLLINRRISLGIFGLFTVASVALAHSPGVLAASAAGDAATLDLSGDWILTYGFAPGWTVDSTGHPEPYDMVPGVCPCGVHFDAIGPNALGGTTYKGYFNPRLTGVTPEWRGTFVADTLSDGVGTQLVQMYRKFDLGASDHAYDVWAGNHHIYPTEPDRLEILGGWASVGGEVASFRLSKYQPTP